MIELGKGALFGGETGAAGGREPGVAQNFYGDLAAEIFALGEIDDAHAAFAESAEDAVGTEFLEWRSTGGGFAEDLMGDVGDVLIEHGIAAGIFAEQD